VGTVGEDILSYQKEEMERVVELLPSSCVLELFHYLQDNGARVRSTGKLTWDGTKIVLTEDRNGNSKRENNKLGRENSLPQISKQRSGG